MNKGAKGDILTKARLPQTLLYSAKHLGFSDKNYSKIKRILVKEITNALEKAYNLPREVYTILIKENPPENVGSGGILILDKRKQWCNNWKNLKNITIT